MDIKIKPINDRLLLILILTNVLVIYLHSFDSFKHYYYFFYILDVFFTLIFMWEISINVSQSSGKTLVKKLNISILTNGIKLIFIQFYFQYLLPTIVRFNG